MQIQVLTGDWGLELMHEGSTAAKARPRLQAPGEYPATQAASMHAATCHPTLQLQQLQHNRSPNCYVCCVQ